MQRLPSGPIRTEHEGLHVEALLPAAGAMTALCLMLLALLFVI